MQFFFAYVKMDNEYSQVTELTQKPAFTLGGSCVCF